MSLVRFSQYRWALVVLLCAAGCQQVEITALNQTRDVMNVSVTDTAVPATKVYGTFQVRSINATKQFVTLSSGFEKPVPSFSVLVELPDGTSKTQIITADPTNTTVSVIVGFDKSITINSN